MKRALASHRSDEEGAVAVTTAILLIALVMMAAIVVDLGILRVDHRANQSVADMAVTAGAMELGASADRVAACNKAWAYLMENLDEVPANQLQPAGNDCATNFAGACDPAVADEMVVPLAGGALEVVIRMPVADGLPVMQPTRQAIVTDIDGTPCERMAIEIVRDRVHNLAGVAGFTDGSSLSGAVARRVQIGESELYASLVVLDREQCQTIRANGGATMRVLSATDAAGTLHPGTIIVDSAPLSCGGQNEVFDLEGSGSRIIAEGDIFSYGLGAGGTPRAGVYNQGQVDDGNLSPAPTPGPQIRRDAIDHRYNCEPTPGRYDVVGPEEFRPRSSWITDPSIDHTNIPACDKGNPSYIRHLYQYLSARIDDVDDTDGDGFVDDNANDAPNARAEFASAGFSIFGDDPTEKCNDVSLLAASTQRLWYIDCGTAKVKNGNQLRIPQADMVVFRGGVDVDAGGVLAINVDATGIEGSSDAVMAVWDGDLAVQGFIRTEQTMTYLNTGRLDKRGAGDLKMEAPLGGACSTPVGSFPDPACFEDLAVWQNGFGTGTQDEFNLGGNGGLTIVGTVFVPNANIDVAGDGFTDLDDAQFFGWRFEYSGTSDLTLIPNPDRATPIKLFGAGLIR